MSINLYVLLFFFNVTAPTEIYTLSLHDALPISWPGTGSAESPEATRCLRIVSISSAGRFYRARSEEHTSELQSQSNLVCRLLLEKKKIILRTSTNIIHPPTTPHHYTT